MAKRGRPKKVESEDKPKKMKFNRILTYKDGTTSTWKFDLEKNPYGPVSVTMN